MTVLLCYFQAALGQKDIPSPKLNCRVSIATPSNRPPSPPSSTLSALTRPFSHKEPLQDELQPGNSHTDFPKWKQSAATKWIKLNNLGTGTHVHPSNQTGIKAPKYQCYFLSLLTSLIPFPCIPWSLFGKGLLQALTWAIIPWVWFDVNWVWSNKSQELVLRLPLP